MDELLRKFVYYEQGSKPLEGLYAFKNKDNTVGIVFGALYGYIAYVDLTTSTSYSSRTVQDWIPTKEEWIQKAQMMKNKR